jgi:hypothetical protein
MASDTQPDWEPGSGDTIEEAAQKAWENAKNSSSPPGHERKKYKLHISIDASNPIHAYIVVIQHGDD